MTVNLFSQCQSSEEESKTCHSNIFIVRPLLLFCKMNTIIKEVNWLHAQWQMKNQQSSHINPSCKEKYVHLFEKCSESQIDYRKDCEPGSKLQLRPKPSSSKIDSSNKSAAFLGSTPCPLLSVAYGDNLTLTKGQLEMCHQIQNCIFAACSTSPLGILEVEGLARSQFTSIIGCLA